MPQWEYCSIQYQDTGGLMYFFYAQDGLGSAVLYHGNNVEKADDVTGKYVATLGLHGWEAINVMRRDDGMEHWYFKRRVSPSNHYLTF